MSSIRIASRYAKSLIDLATEQNKLEKITADVRAFQQAAENRDFFMLLQSPIVNATKKAQIFKALFENQYDATTMAFLNITLSKGREANLPEIATEYLEQYKIRNKVSSVKITTATPLEPAALENIKAQITASGAVSSNLEVQTAVQADLIGGFVIEFDNKLYDASVAYKLEQLKKEFSQRVN